MDKKQITLLVKAETIVDIIVSREIIAAERKFITKKDDPNARVSVQRPSSVVPGHGRILDASAAIPKAADACPNYQDKKACRPQAPRGDGHCAKEGVDCFEA